MDFTKGHGSGNDFIVIPDPDGVLDLGPEDVRALCDRRKGVGGDGVLRAVRTSGVPDVAAWSGSAEWFMDQRNADGSIAQMCANGALVFGRYLVEKKHAAPGRFSIATRAGLREVSISPNGVATIDMGKSSTIETHGVAVRLGSLSLEVVSVSLDVPHGVCILAGADLDELRRLDLTRKPEAALSDFPNGLNLELAVPHQDGIAVRVYERGVGETMSCGSCACAAATAWVTHIGVTLPVTIPVLMRGGLLEVILSEETTLLRGMANLVADGVVRNEELTTAYHSEHV
jgi:diaminopimelate epimerase